MRDCTIWPLPDSPISCRSSLLPLVVTCLHWLSSTLSRSSHTAFSASRTQGPRVQARRLCTVLTPAGAFSRLQGERRPGRVPRGSPAHTCWARSQCQAWRLLILVHPSVGPVHTWLPLVIHSTNISQSTIPYQAQLTTWFAGPQVKWKSMNSCSKIVKNFKMVTAEY